ncbi:MAG: efflux RND transporter permease subunit, partial [Cycloclasticus sp.]
MLNKLINWAVKHRLLVVIALLATIVSASLVLPKLNLDAFPDVTNIQVQINTEARGLAAAEVEQLITFPIEAVMYSLPSVEEVRSISKTGLSVITVVFKEGTDIYFARQLVFQQLQTAREQIPNGIGSPSIGPNTSGLGQVYQYILRADDPQKYDAITLRSYNDWIVKLLLMPVDGVTEVLSFGGEVRQYQVQLNPQKLLAYGLTEDDVAEAVADNNHNAGGWYMDRGAEQLVVRGVGWVRSGEDGLRDIGNTPLKAVAGGVVYVKDVATVNFGAEIRQGAVSITRRDQHGRVEALGEVVAGVVLKRLGANTKETIEGIKARLTAIQQALPDGVSLEPFYDQAELVDQAVSTVASALLQAFVLIVIILMLFIVNVRATVLVL